MSSGFVNCQNCGESNQYARWVDGEFKDYDSLECSNCGFLMYDKKQDYQRREKIVNKKWWQFWKGRRQ